MEILLLLLVVALPCACYTSTVAEAKGYQSANWFLGGLLLGPLALLASIGLPDLKLRRAIDDLLPPPPIGRVPRELDPPERIWRRPSSAPPNPAEGRD